MPAIPIDTGELQARLDEAIGSVHPGARAEPVQELTGGASSITFWTTLSGAEVDGIKVVVKVAPAGLEPTKNRDVLRQARVLSALADTDVPVPRILADHPGGPPEIPPFFVMTYEAGDCLEPNFLPPESQLPPEETRGRELAAAAILGSLHSIDPTDVGLGEEAEVTLDEEVNRWRSSFAACEADLREGSEDVGERLAATTPEMGRTAMLHGDYRLGNTLSEGTGVVSVIDWEIWSRGDARVDLAWFLMMANPDPALNRRACPGMPSNDELLTAYRAESSVVLTEMDWFGALVRYKQAAAGALIARNARRRGQETAMAGGNAGLLGSARLLLA